METLEHVGGDDPAAGSVLHVLPHPGGGGETYVNTLEQMGGYRFERRYLASDSAVRRADRLLLAGIQASRAARSRALLHVHGEVSALLCLPALASRPSLLTLHGMNLLRRTSGASRRAALINLRLAVRTADRTICVSESEHDELVDAVGASLGRRAVVIRNGVTLPDKASAEARAAFRAELGVSDTAVVAVCVGDLDPLKDPLTLAHAALAVAVDADLVLCFAGEGRLRPDLERLAADDGGGALRVLGRREDMGRLYAAAEIVVLASIREGLPFAVLEGMSRGLAPIVSDVPGSVEAVGGAGIVVSRGDVAGFAAALERLAVNVSERASRGIEARKRIERTFTASEMIERTRLLYDEVALSHPHPLRG